MTTEANDFSDLKKGFKPKECRQFPEAKKGKGLDSPLEPQKEPAHFELLVSRTIKNKFVLFEPLTLWCFVTTAVGNKYGNQVEI